MGGGPCPQDGVTLQDWGYESGIASLLPECVRHHTVAAGLRPVPSSFLVGCFRRVSPTPRQRERSDGVGGEGLDILEIQRLWYLVLPYYC
jgi:hypothetical protein